MGLLYGDGLYGDGVYNGAAVVAQGTGLYPSLIQADRPAAWWSLDTADLTLDNTGHGYTLTAQGTPTAATTLLTYGDDASTGAGDFDGSTDAYWTLGSVTDIADAIPARQASATTTATSNATINVSVPDAEDGDLVLVLMTHSTNTATVSTAPSGWTQVGSTLDYTNGAAALYKRLPSQDEYARTVPWVWSASATILAVALVYRGADPDVSGLVYDSGQQATASSTSHATTSETWPDMAAVVAFWADDSTATVTPFLDVNGTTITTVSSGNTELHAVEYEEEVAGSGTKLAFTGASTTLGAFLVSIGSPAKTLNDRLDTIDTAVSVHAVVHPDTVTGIDTIVRKHQAYGLWLDAGVLTFGYRDSADSDKTVTGPTLSAATTYHVIVADDGTDINFYVDGAHTTGTRTGAAGYATNNNRVTVGGYYDGSWSNWYDGQLDEVAVYDGTITPDMAATYWDAYDSGTFGQQMLGTTGAAQAYPSVKLEIAWSSDPTSPFQAFEDVTDYWRGELNVNRGRNFELDRIETGRMAFTLDNRDRRFDPDYTSSPYYPNVIPTRVVRVRAQSHAGAVAYGMFYGYMEGWPLVRQQAGYNALATITAVEVGKALSLDKITVDSVREKEFTGQRLDAILSQVPGLEYTLDTGQSEVVADDLAQFNRLEHALAIAETEGGVLYATGDGWITFQDRHHRVKNERTVRMTFNDQPTGGDYQMRHAEPRFDENRLFTAAAVTPPSGSIKTVSNDTAAAAHFVRTKELNTLHANDNDAQAMAEAYADRYSIPRMRIPEVLLSPVADTDAQAMWEDVLSLDFSYRIATTEHPAGGGTANREHFVEGITHRVRPGSWDVTLSVSPADLDGDYWLLGTGELDTASGLLNTVLGW